MVKSYSPEILGITKNNKVLFVYPHPDDETYCNAGLIQKLMKIGAKIFLLCLTKGEASTLTFSLKSGEKLSDVRQKEFESVMKYLGVVSYKITDLGDGKLADEKERAYEIIRAELEYLKPDYVVTYEPSGIYGHTDHIVVSDIVTELSKLMSIKLIYSTVEKNYKSSESTLNMAKNRSLINPIEPEYQLKLTLGEYLNKLNCFKLYKSQVSVKQDLFLKIYQAYKLLSEYYVLSC